MSSSHALFPTKYVSTTFYFHFRCPSRFVHLTAKQPVTHPSYWRLDFNAYWCQSRITFNLHLLSKTIVRPATICWCDLYLLIRHNRWFTYLSIPFSPSRQSVCWLLRFRDRDVIIPNILSVWTSWFQSSQEIAWFWQAFPSYDPRVVLTDNSMNWACDMVGIQ